MFEDQRHIQDNVLVDFPKIIVARNQEYPERRSRGHLVKICGCFAHARVP